jgi:hypothetical protein
LSETGLAVVVAWMLRPPTLSAAVTETSLNLALSSHAQVGSLTLVVASGARVNTVVGIWMRL